MKLKTWKDTKCPDPDLTGIQEFIRKLDKHDMVYSGMENSQNDNTNWLIKGVLGKGWNMIVSGSAGSGKSIFIMDMCMHLLSGKTWLGYPVTRIKKVLMLQSENPSDILLSRLQKTSHHCQLSKKEYTKGFIISRRDKRFTITREQDRKAIIKIAKKFKPDILIFDSLSKYHESDEKDPSEMTAVLDSFDKIRSELWPSLAIIVIHHDGHNGRERGATSIRAWPEILIGIKGRPGTPQNITFRKSRAIDWPENFQVKAVNYTFIRVSNKQTKGTKQLQDVPVNNYLRKHYAKGCTKTELRALLMKKAKLSRRKADEAIEFALAQAAISEVKDKKDSRKKIIKA